MNRFGGPDNLQALYKVFEIQKFQKNDIGFQWYQTKVIWPRLS